MRRGLSLVTIAAVVCATASCERDTGGTERAPAPAESPQTTAATATVSGLATGPAYDASDPAPEADTDPGTATAPPALGMEAGEDGAAFDVHEACTLQRLPAASAQTACDTMLAARSADDSDWAEAVCRVSALDPAEVAGWSLHQLSIEERAALDLDEVWIAFVRDGVVYLDRAGEAYASAEYGSGEEVSVDHVEAIDLAGAGREAALALPASAVGLDVTWRAWDTDVDDDTMSEEQRVARRVYGLEPDRVSRLAWVSRAWSRGVDAAPGSDATPEGVDATRVEIRRTIELDLASADLVVSATAGSADDDTDGRLAAPGRYRLGAPIACRGPGDRASPSTSANPATATSVPGDRLPGPYADADELCRDWLDSRPTDDANACLPEPSTSVRGDATSAGALGIFDRVSWVEFADPDGTRLGLRFDVAGELFVAPEIVALDPGRVVTTRPMAARSLGEREVATIRWSLAYDEGSTEHLAVCGGGPSGIVSCVRWVTGVQEGPASAAVSPTWDDESVTFALDAGSDPELSKRLVVTGEPLAPEFP